MLLKVKSMRLLTGKPIAVLHKNTAQKLAVYEGQRIRIKNSHYIVAVVNIAEGILKEDEIRLSVEVIKILSLKENQIVEVFSEPPPRSINYILAKLHNKELSREQLYELTGDIVHNTLTESELAYFISGVYINGMTEREIANFTKSMTEFGKILSLEGEVYDKHCIGGIAGNRTTPLVISICASAGLIMPKTSSRAITSAAGTADVIETLARIDFSLGELKRIIKKVGGCMVWGGSLKLAPADDKIIQVEKLMSIDPIAQLVASILSKKLAVKAKGILLDIPYGKSAKVLTKIKAEELGKKFRRVARFLGLNLKPILTDGSQPIGNGIGPVLEARDVIGVLSRSPTRPLDLEKKSLQLAGEILEMAGKSNDGIAMAKEILFSGKAFEKFKEIINAQDGEVDLEKLKPAKFSCKINARKKGLVKEINNKLIAAVARAAGCPSDKSAGVYLVVHKGMKVTSTSSLLTIYAETQSKLDHAREVYNKISPITIE